MKKTIIALPVALVALAAMTFAGVAFSAGPKEVSLSLRGKAIEAPDEAARPSRQTVVQGGFTRYYDEHPPMTPHGIERDEIRLGVNTCMNCHSEETHQKENAPRLSDSHYIGPDGKKLSKPTGERYFCMQCHPPQMEVSPLVGSGFVGTR